MTFLDPGPERHPHAIDFGANAGMADAGVDGVGKINRRGPARQFHHIALGREAEDLIAEQFQLGVLKELFGGVVAVKQINRLPDPSKGAAVASQRVQMARVCRHAVLIETVASDPVLRDSVHGVVADLQLHTA